MGEAEIVEQIAAAVLEHLKNHQLSRAFPRLAFQKSAKAADGGEERAPKVAKVDPVRVRSDGRYTHPHAPCHGYNGPGTLQRVKIARFSPERYKHI